MAYLGPRGSLSIRWCLRRSRSKAPKFGEVAFPFHLAAQEEQVPPSRALEQLGERQVDEVALRPTLEPPKPLAHQAIVEHDVGSAHDSPRSDCNVGWCTVPAVLGVSISRRAVKPLAGTPKRHRRSRGSAWHTRAGSAGAARSRRNRGP